VFLHDEMQSIGDMHPEEFTCDNLKARPLALAITTIAGFSSIDASAQEDRFAFHGYGNQDYRQSSANSYLGADPRGTWDNNFLGLVFTGTINERSQVWAQLQANSTEQARVTWMFVDYQFNDVLRAHVGRVKFHSVSTTSTSTRRRCR